MSQQRKCTYPTCIDLVLLHCIRLTTLKKRQSVGPSICPITSCQSTPISHIISSTRIQMLPLVFFQLVPASLLVFIATSPTVTRALVKPWPFGLGSLERSKSELESSTSRDGTPIRQHTDQVPIAVRKMSGDKGEMFFPEYWQFETETDSASKLGLEERRSLSRPLGPLEEKSTVKDWANASIQQLLQAPYALHTNEHLETRSLFSRLLRSPEAIFALDTRSFACPGGTSACTSINRPNSCCATGLVCQITTDAGLGDVGCCGSGQVCGNTVAGCPAGDTACPDSLGGGCCIPGSVCDSVGCEFMVLLPNSHTMLILDF